MAKEKTEAHEAPSCPFNIGVALEGCEIDQCLTCGWNPNEEKRRKETLRRMEEAGKLVNGKPLRV